MGCRCGRWTELTGELQYLSERFWDGCSGVVGKCGKVDVDCGWNIFSAKLVWNFSVSLGERKRQCSFFKIRTLPYNQIYISLYRHIFATFYIRHDNFTLFLFSKIITHRCCIPIIFPSSHACSISIGNCPKSILQTSIIIVF